MKLVDENEKIMGLNRKNFVAEILNLEFGGNIKKCAISLNMNPSYLHDLVFVTSRDAGIKTLNKIYNYCIKTGKNPERYIFKMPR